MISCCIASARFVLCRFFFFNDTATTEIYTYLHTLSRHDALPICGVPDNRSRCRDRCPWSPRTAAQPLRSSGRPRAPIRSEEHTSELQSLMRISYAVFCLKKKKKDIRTQTTQIQNQNDLNKVQNTKHIKRHSR